MLGSCRGWRAGSRPRTGFRSWSWRPIAGSRCRPPRSRSRAATRAKSSPRCERCTAPSPCRTSRAFSTLLEHPDPLVRDAALLTSLHHGSLPGWAFCQSLALDPKEPHPLAMTLLAGLGEPGQHKRLAQQLDSDAHRPGALRAIGYSGNVGMIPALVFHTHSKDERTVKLAGEAISTITGEEVNAFVRPEKPAPETNGELPPPEEDEEAKRSLPPLAEDDLDADLVPPAEEGLPTLDPEAVSGWWKTARTRFDPQRRHLGGVLATRSAASRGD